MYIFRNQYKNDKRSAFFGLKTHETPLVLENVSLN